MSKYGRRESKKPKSTSYDTLRRLKKEGGSRLDEYEVNTEIKSWYFFFLTVIYL